MLLADQIGWWRHYVVNLSICLSVRPFVFCYETCQHHILETDVIIDVNWQKWSVGQGHEIFDLGVMR